MAFGYFLTPQAPHLALHAPHLALQALTFVLLAPHLALQPPLALQAPHLLALCALHFLPVHGVHEAIADPLRAAPVTTAAAIDRATIVESELIVMLLIGEIPRRIGLRVECKPGTLRPGFA
jgi:hypothetical protein